MKKSLLLLAVGLCAVTLVGCKEPKIVGHFDNAKVVSTQVTFMDGDTITLEHNGQVTTSYVDGMGLYDWKLITPGTLVSGDITEDGSIRNLAVNGILQSTTISIGK